MIDWGIVRNLTKKYQPDLLILISLFFLAFIIYIYKIDIITPGIQGDELTVAKASEQILSSPEFVPFTPINYGHATPLLYFTGMSIEIFGRTIMAIRLPSVIFGALSVAAFYLLLRLFFNRIIAIPSSLLMLFSYPFIILSRLAYEVTPQIFFQILAIIFLYFAWKKKDNRFFAAIGLSLGVGLYTYVGFRTFAVLAIMITLAIISQVKTSLSTKIKKFLVMIACLFIVSVPLISYGLGHSTEIMARTTVLSPFNQQYSQDEIFKELQANTMRLSQLFFMQDKTVFPNGDTNYTRNPSNVSVFDLGTGLLLIIGILFLLRTKRKLSVFIVILSISPLINDIFVIEKIPEALHPYGIGHPNTLRIAGIIPVIYFVIAFGANEIDKMSKSINKNIFRTTLVLVTVLLIVNSWYLYYQQPLNQWYSPFIYEINDLKGQRVADAINKLHVQKVYISPSFITNERVKYFVKKNVEIIPYKPTTMDKIISDSNSLNVIIFDPNFNLSLGKAYLTKIQSQPSMFHGQIIQSPDNKIDAFILGVYNLDTM